MDVVCVRCRVVGVGTGVRAGQFGVVVAAAVLSGAGHVVFTGCHGVGLTALQVNSSQF